MSQHPYITVEGPRGQPLRVLFGDFETAYGDGLGFKSQTNTEYVRDTRFRAHGATLGFTPYDAKWISHDDLPAYFADVDWENVAFCAHNTYFDGFIETQHYRYVPAMWLDTQTMSRGDFGVEVLHRLSALAHRAHQAGYLTDGLPDDSTLLGWRGFVFRDRYKELCAKYNPWGKFEGELNTYGKMTLTLEEEQEMLPYAVQDWWLLYKVFEWLYYERAFPDKELQTVHITLKAYCEPKLRIDHALCRQAAEEDVEMTQRLVQASGIAASRLSSNKQFAQVLLDHGVVPPTKINKNGDETWAFSKKDLAFQALRSDPRVTDIMAARLAVKSTINATRAHRLIAHSRPTLPVMLITYGAHTQRWTAGDLVNMQNLPQARKGQTDILRRAIRAPEGYLFLVIDLSQIEARVAAWFAGQQDLLDRFGAGEDVYSHFASEVYGYKVTGETHPAERQVGKTGILSLQFGVGRDTFALQVRAGYSGPPMPIEDETAAKAVRVYRTTNNKVSGTWDEMSGILARMTYMEEDDSYPWRGLRYFSNRVMMPNGLCLHYPGLTSQEGPRGPEYHYRGRDGLVKMYGAKFFQNHVQCLARIIAAERTVELAKRYPDIVLLVHDEVVALIPEAEREEALNYGLKTFRTAEGWYEDIPLDCDGACGPAYTH